MTELLLQAAGKKPGDVVQMGPDKGFDLSTAVQKSAEGAGSTALPLILSTVNPAVGIAAGQQSIVGELSTELNRFIESDLELKTRNFIKMHWQQTRVMKLKPYRRYNNRLVPRLKLRLLF